MKNPKNDLPSVAPLERRSVRFTGAFQTGFLLTLGGLLAIVLGMALTQLSTILTYIGAALFLAIGLDPLISILEKRNIPRPFAILIVVVVVLGAFTGLMFMIVPAVANQVGVLAQEIPNLVQKVENSGFIDDALKQYPFLRDVGQNLLNYLQENVTQISQQVLQIGLGVANGVFGGIIIVILTLYFVSSLNSMKRGLYRLMPASSRSRFAELTEQITTSVGRYVVGQVSLGLVNGVLTFIVQAFIFKGQLPAVSAVVAFVCSLIPLVGTLSGAVIITLLQILLLPTSPATWIATAIYYLVYMQIEAYVVSPRIMNKAVQVPGALVVIAALVGGTLLGILGALIAIPVAASILLIVKEVVIPRQNAK